MGIEYKLSVQRPDRSNDIVMVRGIDTKNYLVNPIVLFNHNPDLIVGRASNLYVKDDAMYGTVEYQEETQLGREIKALAVNGFLKAVSIGFLQKSNPKSIKIDEEMRKSGEFYPHTDSVRVFENTELIEFSIVATPANPYAIQNDFKDLVIKEFGIESEILKHLEIPITETIKKVCPIDDPECGCNDKKKDMEEVPVIEKVGAVLNKTNFDRLNDIVRLAKEIMDSAVKEAPVATKPRAPKAPVKRYTEKILEDIINKIKE